MITLRGVGKGYGSQVLLEKADLQINAGDRYALVGPNGAGKSTLFKMLLGEVEPDSGQIEIKRGLRPGYLQQENAPKTDASVLAETLAWTEHPDGRMIAKAKAILMGLGFKVEEFEKKVRELSGGWAMRVAMARLLLVEPDLLMLDEPTNHLDLDSLLWLQEYLDSYPGAIFLISHERDFINHVCDSIVSVQDRTLRVYRGDYEFYVREKAAERERQIKAYEEQQAEIKKMQEFIDRNRVRASTAARAQSMIKRMERLERIELPEDTKTVKIRFPQPNRTGVRSVQLKNLYKSYGDVKVYEGLDLEIERGWRVAFVGHNGAGKSTLLKVLGGIIPFDSGERKLGLNVKVGYFSQHREGQFDPEKTVFEEAMDNDRMNPELMVRTILGTFLFPGDMIYKKTKVLSGGEKSRLGLVKLLLDPPNVLLLDEPTTHLDMASVDALIEALKEFEGTICVISHDVYFLNALATHVFHVDHGHVTVYPGNYEYFERRHAQKEAEAAARAAGKPAPKIDENKLSQKEERKRRAAERESGRAVKRLEEEIEAGYKKLEELGEQMSDPAIYADYQKVQKLGDEMTSLQDSLAAKEAELGRLSS